MIQITDKNLVRTLNVIVQNQDVKPVIVNVMRKVESVDNYVVAPIVTI
jgi:hypothetical protein